MAQTNFSSDSAAAGFEANEKHVTGSPTGPAALQQQAEELMRLNRQLLAAVEQSANTIVITDTRGIIEYANPKFVETTGYTLAEAIGQHTRILKSGETTPEEYKQLWETITAGGQWRGEFHNRKKNGELYWETATISPIKNEAGEITHFLAVKEDITARKAAQEALAKRAQELEVLQAQTHRRAVELEAVAEISTVASAAIDVETLLQAVVDMTKSSFGLYHAHIYLFNSANNRLELAAGAGEIGRRMVGKGWTIPLDHPTSIVARAGRTQHGVIENNVRQTDQFMPNPLLPDTASELAVPLMAGDKLLGVLDVQSDVQFRFTEDDIHIKTTLATQVAVTLENARLLQETQAALVKVEATQRRYTAQGWDNYRARKKLSRYHTGPADVAISDYKPPAAIEAAVIDQKTTVLVQTPARNSDELPSTEAEHSASGSGLFTPLTVRDEVIGVLGVEDPGGMRRWTPEEIAFVEAVAEQMALAAEELRLLDETQQRAAREQLTRQITDKIRSSQTIEAALKTAAVELSRALGVAKASVNLAVAENTEPSKPGTG